MSLKVGFVLVIADILIQATLQYTPSYELSDYCKKPLISGPQFNISSEQLTESSFWNGDLAADKSRLADCIDSQEFYCGWVPHRYPVGEYIQADLGAEFRITAVATKGVSSGTYERYVTGYQIGFSNDGINFNWTEVMQGNTNGHEVVENTFNPSRSGRYIRLNITSASILTLTVLSWELYGCSACSEPLISGSNLHIPPEQLTASSVISTNPSYSANASRLILCYYNSFLCFWMPRDGISDYIQADLGEEFRVTSVLTQGIASASSSDQLFVTQYKMGFSADESNFQWTEVLEGNENGNEIVENVFIPGHYARYVRLEIAGTSQTDLTALRWELLGCRDPVDCVYKWMDGGVCSTTCGDGVKTQVLQITAEARGTGTACPTNNTRAQPCSGGVCPVDCDYEWRDSGDCSVTCGEGIQTQTLVITEFQVGDGEPCPLATSKTRLCTESVCPVDCVYEWMDSNDCSVTCGDGVRTQVLNVTTQAVGAGVPCPDTDTKTVTCTEITCPVDCVHEWVDTGDCSVTCGDGVGTLVLNITTQAVGTGAPCPDADTQTVACSKDPCVACPEDPTGEHCQHTLPDPDLLVVFESQALVRINMASSPATQEQIVQRPATASDIVAFAADWNRRRVFYTRQDGIYSVDIDETNPSNPASLQEHTGTWPAADAVEWNSIKSLKADAVVKLVFFTWEHYIYGMKYSGEKTGKTDGLQALWSGLGVDYLTMDMTERNFYFGNDQDLKKCTYEFTDCADVSISFIRWPQELHWDLGHPDLLYFAGIVPGVDPARDRHGVVQSYNLMTGETQEVYRSDTGARGFVGIDMRGSILYLKPYKCTNGYGVVVDKCPIIAFDTVTSEATLVVGAEVHKYGGITFILE